MGPLKSHLIVAGASFVAGTFAMGVLVWRLAPPPIGAASVQASAQKPTVAAGTPVISDDAIADLRRRHLELPVEGATPASLRDSFDEARSSGGKHEAIDILAPRNTPVLAVEDGTVAKLFLSKAGGITIYQFDPTTTYAYYYAHLERYADGLTEGARVARKQIIGYVGTSGDAPKDTPHLHFSIFKLSEKKQWWVGTAINPYAVWR